MVGPEVRRRDVERWAVQLDGVAERIGDRFPRAEPRQRARAYLRGLLCPVDRKNGWQLAEQAGDVKPYGIQHLLGRAEWDAEAVRDDLRSYVVEHLGAPDGILILDETGFLKKGRHSAGVARQYSGTAGRIENCQIGVFLAYATAKGCAFLDRALYLPREWTDHRERCRAAGIADEIGFATKGEIAKQMLERAIEAKVPCAWVTGDEVYGGDGNLRRFLESVPVGYVLAVRSNQSVWAGLWQRQVKTFIAALPAKAWRTITIADGTKGPRRYRWARLPINHVLPPPFQRWLLARRSLSDPEDIAYYLAAGPQNTSLAKLAQVAGARWNIEVAFEAAKQEVGLDEYEVRSYHGWQRHITLVLLAHAVLAVVRHDANERKARPSKKSRLLR